MFLNNAMDFCREVEMYNFIGRFDRPQYAEVST